MLIIVLEIMVRLGSYRFFRFLHSTDYHTPESQESTEKSVFENSKFLRLKRDRKEFHPHGRIDGFLRSLLSLKNFKFLKTFFQSIYETLEYGYQLNGISVWWKNSLSNRIFYDLNLTIISTSIISILN